MANIDNIDNDFQQQGNVCVLASYGTVLHYFSDGVISVENLLSKYSEKFEIKPTTSTGIDLESFQNQISDHFHGYCRSKNMRGFEYIKQLHKNDDLKTKDICQIVVDKASLKPIEQPDIDLIRNELENNDSLAMILYNVGANKYHAVTIGYNSITSEYFCKDTGQRSIINVDLLDKKEITEYIIFKRN
jgi:hypothetical protein